MGIGWKVVRGKSSYRETRTQFNSIHFIFENGTLFMAIKIRLQCSYVFSIMEQNMALTEASISILEALHLITNVDIRYQIKKTLNQQIEYFRAKGVYPCI